MNRKTTIVIISGITLLIIISVGAYYLFQKKLQPAPQPGVLFPKGGEPITGTPTPVEAFTLTDENSFFPGEDKIFPRLYELHSTPVAGVGFYETGKGASYTATARYIERGLGYVFETPLATLLESRIVNETRTQLAEALWGNNGKSVVVRGVTESDNGLVIKTSILNIGTLTPTPTTELNAEEEIIQNPTATEEIILPDYIPFVATAEDGADKVFYLESGVGASSGSITSFKNIKNTQVFNSPFTEWLPQLPNQNLATVTSKPSGTVPGHLFFIDLKTKALTKILGGINGLTTLTSRDGKFVLYGEIKDGEPELVLYHVTKKERSELFLTTFPEKCVWGKKNVTLIYCAVPQSLPQVLYPDQWYQGVVSFSDEIWEINTTTKETRKIMTPSEFGVQAIDVINPAISSTDEYLLFMNKITGTPWIYRLTETVPTKAPTNTATKTTEAPLVTSDLQKIK